MSASVVLLKSCYLFQDLPAHLLEKVAERIRFDRFGPREVIFHEGDAGDTLFLLQQGEVEVRKKDRESGITFHLTKLQAPAAFGEIALLKDAARSASVISLGDTQVGMLKGDDFQQLVQKIPEFAVAMARGLAERVDSLSRERRMSYSQLSQLHYDAQVLGMLPKKSIQTLKALPLAYNGTALSVAMVNPQDLSALEHLRQMVRGVMIEPVVVSASDFQRFMDTVYDRVVSGKALSETATAALDISALMDEIDADLRDLNRHDTHSVVQLARDLLLQAVRQNASELHLEPRAEQLLVRGRINGQLSILNTLPRGLQPDLVARFKSMAQLDPAASSQDQHGSIHINDAGLDILFAVDTLPTRYGEKLVVSLPKSGSIPMLDQILESAPERQNLSQLLTLPHGLVLVLGPAGSGKTTTLYSLMRQLAEREVNAYAIGDRLAYDLERVNRVETGPQWALPQALQAVLNQHPDVILLEDLPDLTSFKLAINAALSGRLVISAFAATGLDAALMRFQLMGGERQTLIDALAGTLTQRLVRRLCPNCQEAYAPDFVILQRLGLNSDDPLYRSKGCSVCQNTGYRGRVAVNEVLVLNPEQRDALHAGARLSQLHRSGQRSLQDCGLELLRAGQTTPAELLRELML
ncbi:MAG: ATPase, T2SS/T4P/T4SS family [Candidatus Sericytochromatia bacterium]